MAQPDPVHRSRHLAREKVASSCASKQQHAIIHRLGIAREGERIGDEALQAYLELFSRPLSSEHISAILSLFGWESVALPLEDGVGVEVLG